MNKALYDIIRRGTAWFQSAKGSYKRHNNQYEGSGKLQEERVHGQRMIKEDAVNGPEMRAKDLLDKHQNVRLVVDIGSGTGWCAASLSPVVDEVIAIEPSRAALEIAKELYPPATYANISWIEGFAEVELKKMKLGGPAMFFTGCVLSHIRDKEVMKICHSVTQVASVGSVLSFAECFGDEEWHQLMWHVRTKDWWRSQFPEWELTFHGPQVLGEIYHKGFWGVKVK